jgi:hypothetical protein
LGNIASFHYISLFGPTGNNEVSLEEFSNLRSEAGTGDHSLFIRRLIAAANHRDEPDALHTMFYGTEIRARHSDNFKRTFGRVLKAADAVDTDEIMREALLEGAAAGMLYRIIHHISGEEPMNPITAQSTNAVPLRTSSSAE